MDNKKLVYADCAATTQTAPEVIAAMQPYFSEMFGNPSSSYKPGRTAKKAVASAREYVADLLGALPEEIFFTSCGTESNNLAIKSTVIKALAEGDTKRRRLVVSSIEHPSVLRACESVIPLGFSIDYIPVGDDGTVDIKAMERLMGDDCLLAAVMHANNETGVIQPVAQCAELAHSCGALFLSDAVQSAGHIPVDVKSIGCDFLSISGHKLNAPKGIGAVYVKSGIKIPALISGGGQERGMRGGTENVPYIAGLGEACRIAGEGLKNGEAEKIATLRDSIEKKLLSCGCCRVNGTAARVPGTLNMSFECVEGESVMLVCDMHGVCISTGSACSNGHGDEVSHVLRAMRVPDSMSNGSVRISIGRYTTANEAETIAAVVCESISKLRAMSAEWENKVRGTQA